nr:class I tRNA ligase family protein [Acidobacteriota bacterium]
SVFGWPEKTRDLARYYPTDVLVTGFDIIFFWVARMIMAGLRLSGEVPFRTVLYHGLVRDAEGRKMSKSTGNALEPEDAMARHGVDALRFTLAAQASPGSDLALSEERLAGYRAFMNKLWNATRFMLMRLPEEPAAARTEYSDAEYDEVDRYLAARYLDLVDEVDRAMHDYRFDHAAAAIYHFLWGTFCDWCIELAKPDLAEGAEPRRSAVRRALLFDVLDGSLRLLHPIAPFITEELWQHLPRRSGDPAFLAVADFPVPARPGIPVPGGFDRAAAAARVERFLIAPVSAARALRTGANVPPSRKITVQLRPRTAEAAAPLAAFAPRIALLTNAEAVGVIDRAADPGPALRQVLDDLEVVIPLAGAVDTAAERARLEKEQAKLSKDLEAVRTKLGNPSFVERAPAEVVEKERGRITALEGRLAELAALLDGLR